MEDLKWTKDENGSNNTIYCGHKIRITKNENKLWTLSILKKEAIEYGETQFEVLWDDFKTLKSAKEEVTLIGLEIL